MPCITVDTLSGHSVMVNLSSSATLNDLWGAIGAQLDVPSKHLQLSLGESLLPADKSIMLEAAGIESDTRISAIVRQGPSLPVLPNAFEVNLSSSRMRLGAHRNSSAFTMIYNLKVDVCKNHVQASVVRKSDTDHFEFDGHKGCWKGSHGHWMAGTTQIEEQALPCFDLKDVLRDWMDRAEVVMDVEKQLWTMPLGDVAKNEGDLPDENPKTLFPLQVEWFVAPSSDCFELYVNAPFPVSGPRSSSLHIARILVDASGIPVRAALYHQDSNDRGTRKVVPSEHLEKADVQDMARAGNSLLEEYDVTLTC